MSSLPPPPPKKAMGRVKGPLSYFPDSQKKQQRTNAADAQPAPSLYAPSIHPSPLACRLKEQVSSFSAPASPYSFSLLSLKAD